MADSLGKLAVGYLRDARARRSWRHGYAVAAFGLFIWLFDAVRAHRCDALDLALTRWVQRWRVPGLSQLMWLASWSGFPPQSRLIPPMLAVIWWRRGMRLEARMQLMAWGVSGISGIVKLAMRRQRPAEPHVRIVTAKLGGSSFPSGHVLNYVGTFGFAALVLRDRLPSSALQRGTVGCLVALIALVGPSRVYQGHHWPSDVVASYLAGSGYLALVADLYAQLRRQEDMSRYDLSRRT